MEERERRLRNRERAAAADADAAAAVQAAARAGLDEAAAQQQGGSPSAAQRSSRASPPNVSAAAAAAAAVASASTTATADATAESVARALQRAGFRSAGSERLQALRRSMDTEQGAGERAVFAARHNSLLKSRQVAAEALVMAQEAAQALKSHEERFTTTAATETEANSSVAGSHYA